MTKIPVPNRLFNLLYYFVLGGHTGEGPMSCHVTQSNSEGKLDTFDYQGEIRGSI